MNVRIKSMSNAILSNATTLITVPGKEYTIVAALDAPFNGSKKADEASITVFVNPVIERHQPGVLNPLEISKVIKQLEKEILDVEANIDYPNLTLPPKSKLKMVWKLYQIKKLVFV
ncbi:hypothetical protein ACTFIT_001947 [Dictyostelium discoideum]